jgi:carbonic anhydrase
MPKRLFAHSLVLLCLAAIAGAQDKVSNADQALAALKAGNAHALQTGGSPQPGDRSKLAKGQQPFAAILSCADSRVPPELIFDKGPGEIFVVRVAGNVSDPTTLGSIEYSVEHLHAKLVVVMGHSDCGAVKASMAPKADQRKLALNIQHFVSLVHPITGKSSLKESTVHNVRAQLALVMKDPVIRREVAAGKIKVVGAYYDIATGRVMFL